MDCRKSLAVASVIHWFFVVLWMSAIFLLSNEPSQESSMRSDALVAILQSIGLSGSADLLSTIIRKLAHISLYAILGGLIFLALTVRRPGFRKLAMYSVLAASLYAVADELHQSYIPGRSGELRDVLIDTLGASIGVLCMYLYRVKQRPKFTESTQSAKVSE